MRSLHLIVIIFLLGSGHSVPAGEHSHHSDAKNTEIQLDHGKKWATDISLRRAMKSLNDLARENLPAIHAGTFSDESYKKMGMAMVEQTNLIFKNCKLSPDADKELHKILINILNSEKVFMNKDQTVNKHDAFVSILNSLKLYGSYFQHDGWNSAE